MARRVYYRISDRPDGCFDAVVTIEPDTVVRREGFVSLAEVEDWIEGLRDLMAALGAPLAQAESDKGPDRAEIRSDYLCLPGGLRMRR
ncbi:hypothetical protein SAMN05216360_114128 [Methylobacterium phyllostachyos]|uniref:Uncharacterized protein n=1 Tax=Methylobacterium phyllostachyos TaxID=582672 RepID=A0A1H0GKX7_9HYPH|nr:hypothetical protein [Methylobacterium phyllostachyos]SDO07544.1 hypothetical protein SAMN05216360_114128 [Methylobacterium phyllostachyos]